MWLIWECGEQRLCRKVGAGDGSMGERIYNLLKPGILLPFYAGFLCAPSPFWGVIGQRFSGGSGDVAFLQEALSTCLNPYLCLSGNLCPQQTQANNNVACQWNHLEAIKASICGCGPGHWLTYPSSSFGGFYRQNWWYLPHAWEVWCKYSMSQKGSLMPNGPWVLCQGLKSWSENTLFLNQGPWKT